MLPSIGPLILKNSWLEIVYLGKISMKIKFNKRIRIFGYFANVLKFLIKSLTWKNIYMV